MLILWLAVSLLFFSSVEKVDICIYYFFFLLLLLAQLARFQNWKAAFSAFISTFAIAKTLCWIHRLFHFTVHTIRQHMNHFYIFFFQCKMRLYKWEIFFFFSFCNNDFTYCVSHEKCIHEKWGKKVYKKIWENEMNRNPIMNNMADLHQHIGPRVMPHRFCILFCS